MDPHEAWTRREKLNTDIGPRPDGPARVVAGSNCRASRGGPSTRSAVRVWPGLCPWAMTRVVALSHGPGHGPGSCLGPWPGP